jgi:RNA-directed DNA polymerase
VHTIEALNPVLLGWMAYFRATEGKDILETLDSWLRRRLRCLLWWQWKRPRRRTRRMIALGIPRERAWLSAMNGRRPWWNAGASHLSVALPASYFTHLGWSRCSQPSSDSGLVHEPPYAEPHVRWCGRATG